MSYKKPKEPGLIPSKSTLGKKTRNPGYEPGNHWVICDRCGFATRANDARITWDNLVVCPADWEPRHPQDFVRGREDKIAPSEPIRPEGPDQFVESPAPNLVAPIIDYTDIGDGNFYFDGWADYPEYQYLVLDADTGEVIGECEVELGEEYYFWYETEVNQDGPFNFQVIIRNEKDDRTSPPSNIVGYFPAPYISITDETDETFSFRGIAEYPNADYLVFDGSTGQQVGICLVYYDVLEGTYFFSFETEKGDEGPFDFYVEIFEQSTDKRSIESNTVGYAPPVTDMLVISASGQVLVSTPSNFPLRYSENGRNWYEFTGNVTLYPYEDHVYLSASADTPLPSASTIVSIGRLATSSGFEGIVSWWELGVRLEIGSQNTRNFFLPPTAPPNVTSYRNMFYGASGFNDPNIALWDTSSVTDMSILFGGASSFNQPIGSWETSNVSTMERMFENATAFNQDLSSWDTSNVTTMYQMFRGSSSFNSDISGWKVGNVTQMQRMFYQATVFNQDLSSWCVSNILSTPLQFDGLTPAWVKPGRQPVWGTCPVPVPGNTIALTVGPTSGIYFYSVNTSPDPFEYSQDLSNWTTITVNPVMIPTVEGSLYIRIRAGQPIWPITRVAIGDKMSDIRAVTHWWDNGLQLKLDTSAEEMTVPNYAPPNQTSMYQMFRFNSALTGDLSGWDVSSVTNMHEMFYGASKFNSDISGWDVSNVSAAQRLFNNASSFNQPIGNWDVSKIADMRYMFAGATAFNQDLSGWYVPLISTKPSTFDTSTPNWVKPGRQPQWGVSPP